MAQSPCADSKIFLAFTRIGADCRRSAAQVFEYLSTDLKKYMDRTGKGANGTPVPKKLIKVPHRLRSMTTQ